MGGRRVSVRSRNHRFYAPSDDTLSPCVRRPPWATPGRDGDPAGRSLSPNVPENPLFGLRGRGDLAAGGALLEAALARRGRRPADLLPGGLLAAVDGVGHGEPLEGDDLGGPGGRVEQGDRALAPEPAARFSGVDEENPVPALDQGPVGVAEDDDVVGS